MTIPNEAIEAAKRAYEIDTYWTLDDRIAAILEAAAPFLVPQPSTREGHGRPCYYCGGPCDDLAGDPGQWSISLCHSGDPGHVKWHHVRCVTERLVENQPQPSAPLPPKQVREAIEQLRAHQDQLDRDGVFVGVSRQALDEVLAYIAVMNRAPQATYHDDGRKRGTTAIHVKPGQSVTEAAAAMRRAPQASFKDAALAEKEGTADEGGAEDSRAYDDGLRRAAEIAQRIGSAHMNDCERLSMMDPETGLNECSLEVRGRDCLCVERQETGEEIATAILAELGTAPQQSGMFRDHSCWKCMDGKTPCVVGNSRQCEYPHARND